jgi:hypothetical protein
MDDVGVRLVRAKGRPFDKHRCFFIKDFSAGDSIRVYSDDGLIVRGVVQSIDMDTLEVVYRTSVSPDNRAFVADIVSLEHRKQNWLEE